MRRLACHSASLYNNLSREHRRHNCRSICYLVDTWQVVSSSSETDTTQAMASNFPGSCFHNSLLWRTVTNERVRGHILRCGNRAASKSQWLDKVYLIS
jgi:hypothetical protein